jgi:hypothetical protein
MLSTQCRSIGKQNKEAKTRQQHPKRKKNPNKIFLKPCPTRGYTSMREPQTLHYRGKRKQREKNKEKEKKLTVSDKEAAKSKQENKTMPKSRSDLDTAIITSQTKKTNKQTGIQHRLWPRTKSSIDVL